ncbi:MAG: MaoC family dehydratase N-terminal domain-containing protein [Erythrobacter sp.]
MADQWDDWIGRESRQSDQLGQAMAARWLATFDLQQPAGDQTMPQGIHFALCTPDSPTGRLGEDGHPLRDESAGSFLPPVPMPRRMWASSKITFHNAIGIGAAIERVSRIASINAKSGGSGDLVFVDVEHETSADGLLAVSETQTLVYRGAAAAEAPLSPPPTGGEQFDASAWTSNHTLTPDPRLLFRYSALTFNSHRIHYDVPYAQDKERYRGLVVHGPLTASLLLQLAGRELGSNAAKTFQFRGKSPGIAGEVLHLALRQNPDQAGAFELGAFAADGRQVMSANAAI